MTEPDTPVPQPRDLHGNPVTVVRSAGSVTQRYPDGRAVEYVMEWVGKTNKGEK